MAHAPTTTPTYPLASMPLWSLPSLLLPWKKYLSMFLPKAKCLSMDQIPFLLASSRTLLNFPTLLITSSAYKQKLKYLPSLGKKPTFNSVSSSSNHSIYLRVPYSTHIQSPATLSHKLLKRFYVNTSNSSPPIPAFLNPFQLNFHLHLPPHHTKTTQKGTLLFGGPQK